MLRIDHITYAIEGKPLFEDASATIPTGHKVGIVGRNGAGKTTLFRLIRGELSLEGGAIAIPNKARIGGVAVELDGAIGGVGAVQRQQHENCCQMPSAGENADQAMRLGGHHRHQHRQT